MSTLKTPSRRLGIAGDGQLARMMAQAAPPLGIEVIVYGTSRASPAGQVVREMVVAEDYYDPTAWQRFAKSVDVVTAEWENVPVPMLQFLEKSVPVFPSPRCFEISSNRQLEKEFAKSLGIATAPYLSVAPGQKLDAALVARHLPGILKTCSGGYDGHGQISINTLQEFNNEQAIINVSSTSGVLERRLTFSYEISVIGVRSRSGEIALYPPVHNRHEKGVLRHTFYGTHGAWTGIPPQVREEAELMTRTILEHLDYVGVLAVEMFVMPDETVLFNEMAPRVHNSGHWTIEGCLTSQFANHVLAVCDFPLGRIEPRCQSAVMMNILGEEIEPYRKGPVPLLGLGRNTFIHDYGKAEVRPGRKMGHLTAVIT